MRYLGNKSSITEKIDNLLEEKKLNDKNLILFDAFCGTGSVADSLKGKFNIIINDNLTWAVHYAKGRLLAPECSFETLGFNPFDYFNNTDGFKHGFIYNNYAPGKSGRMYFSDSNAEKIDFFREEIETWREKNLINESEYSYLLACLIESVSAVSNTAGVYGAFLKKWDSRALKDIKFISVEYGNEKCSLVDSLNSKIEDIIENVKCDILYLDPPYTQNQYGTQYHLLETLILNDNPTVSKITGSRPTGPMRSDWSKDIMSHILFERIIAKTKARHIVFSYNNDGFMTKEYIESILKRYGIAETYTCKKISYKKYENWKSQKGKEHFEYLFYIEKKEKEKYYFESPLNYIGSKARIVQQIKDNIEIMPGGKLYDLFGGGFNVGINFPENVVIYNDINYFVKGMIESFKTIDTHKFIQYVNNTIKRFGLEKGNAERYIAARDYYNSLSENNRDPRLLFAIIMYGFQQQIRFNGNHKFNNPVGVRWFNDNILAKLICFSRQIKELNVEFYSKPYLEFELEINKNDYVYMDPPYMLTIGAYNDGKRGFNGWNKSQEKELFDFCDRLNQKGTKFMLSYVIEHKSKINAELTEWIKLNGYRVIELGGVLGISGSRRKEVLIVNHE